MGNKPYLRYSCLIRHRHEFCPASLGPDTGERGRDFMKQKIKDDDMPMGRVRKVPDFLPSPEELVIPDETVKITISLNRESVDFFKKQAKKNHTKYQRMIRSLLDTYARQFSR